LPDSRVVRSIFLRSGKPARTVPLYKYLDIEIL